MAQPIIEDLAARLRDVLAKNPGADLEKNVKQVINGAFSRMELVTREEFDRQRDVLAKTREKLEALEEKLQALEKRV
jgi:ubiquinone biosynthesis accessory factor UbiK